MLESGGIYLNKTGAVNAGTRGGAVSLVCGNCGRWFKVRSAEYRRRHTKFCSRACWLIKKRSPARSCAACGCEFAGEAAKFCSIGCKAASQRKLRSPRQIAQRRLEVRIATLMGYSLRGRKAGCRWERLVGYTLVDLMAHLEALFVPGMNWDNIGRWHIDHRRPRSTFEYSSPEDEAFKECWSLENLQPLWAHENMRKGARLNWHKAL